MIEFPLQQEIHTILIMLKTQIQEYFLRCLEHARSRDLDPHDIEASDFPESISEELTSL